MAPSSMKSTLLRERGTELHRLLSAKTVSFLPSVCLLMNAMTGPSIPFTAGLFQTGGGLPTVLGFILFAILSSFCCLFIIEAMQAIPGNKHFQGTVEFATLIHFYFGNISHIIGQVCLYGAIESNAIQSIIISSQQLDNILVDIFHTTCGVAFNSSQAWLCVHSPSQSFPSPFEGTYMLFTLGFLITIALCVPLALVNLDDNINVQVVAFAISWIIALQWIVASMLYYVLPASKKIPALISPGIPAVGSQVGSLAGTIMLSLAGCFVVPSWVNLKKKDVNVQATMWTSSLMTVVMYLLVGIFPALAMPADASGNILSSLSALGIPRILTKITVYAFSLVMLLPSIPVSFIVARENLFQNNLCGYKTSIFLTFILPWIISIPMLTGLSLFSFQMWTSLIFVSTANFIIPVVIYLKCLVFRRAYNADRTILTDKQRLLLKAIHARSDTIKDWVDRAAVRRRHRHGDGEGFKVALQQPDEEILEDMDNINTLPRVSPLLAGVAMESSSSSSASPVQQDSLSRAAGGGGANSSSSSPQQHRSPSPQRNRWYGKDDEQAGEAAAGASPPPIDKRLLSIRRGNTTLRVLFAADSAERKRQQQQQRGPLLLRNVTSRDSLLPPLRSSSVSQSSSSLLPSSSASLLHAVDNTNNNNYVIFEGGGSNDGQQVPANISTDQQPQSDPHQMVIDETVEGYLLEDVPDPFTEDQEMRKLRSRSTERSGFSDILERAVTTLGRRGGGGNNGTGGRSRLRQRADSAGIELRQDSFEDLSARRTIGGGGVGSSSSNLGVAGSRLQQLQSTSDGEVAYTTGGGGSSSASLPRLPAPITATTSPTTAQQQEQPMEITLTDTEGIQHNRDSIERRRRHTAQSLSPHRNSPSPDLLPNNSNKNNNNHLTISRANSAFFRAHTLPHHPQFVSSSVFRSVPQFITVGLGISPRWIAIVVLSLTTFVSVGSIILQIVNAAT